jgi:hypothetical protein
MKAIETVYRGYRFRSRLEARWAVFFDELGVEWQYEPEGFERQLYEDGPTHRWLPDFLLTKTNTWVEVKGSTAQLQQDWERLAQLLDFGGVLPDFCDSGDDRNDGTVPGLLLLGPLPYEDCLTLHPMVTHHKGLARDLVYFTRSGVHRFIRGERYGLDSSPQDWSVDPRFVVSDLNPARHAYLAARQARFEHGQVGAPHQWGRAAT